MADELKINIDGVESELTDCILQQTFNLLEFPRIKAMLQAHTKNFRSNDLAKEIIPSTNSDDVKRMHDETSEAILMLASTGDIGLAGHDDPNPLLRRAALGGVLKGSELIDLVNLFVAIRIARNQILSSHEQLVILKTIANQVPDLSELSTQVLTCVTETGDVKDSATPKLGKLRRDAARAYKNLVVVLERLTARKNARIALQSNNIATRGDRLVLEVKTDSRSAIPGIVHDVSKTGVTLFIEPFQSVELCNTWREKAAEAQREEELVLKQLSNLVGENEEAGVAAVEIMANLDLIISRGRLSTTLNCSRPVTVEHGDPQPVKLIDAKHPLLGDNAVPISVQIGPDFKGLVITGPNTGGKTVAIKTIGLLALMHQCGIQIPAKSGSSLGIFTGIYADIGDAQSIDRSVSTFSSHMGRVANILREADAKSLVLLDELGTGTDPEEGSALARAVLTNLVDRDIPVAVTTHHRIVAEFASSHELISNASVILDPDTLKPSYKLIMGIPGRSYALQVAKTLGLGEDIIEQAEFLLGPERASIDSLLTQIQKEKDEIGIAKTLAGQDARVASITRQDLETKLSEISKHQNDLLQRTRLVLKQESEIIRKKLRQIVSNAENDRNLTTAQNALNRLQNTLSQPTWLPTAVKAIGLNNESTDPIDDKQLEPGDSVEILGLGIEATVLSTIKDGQIELQMGNARIQLSPKQLSLVEKKIIGTVNKNDEVRINTKVAPVNSDELDLRGCRASEIVDLVGKFLDQCVASGLTRCKIIHGAGTGALRQVVRDYLASTDQVQSFSQSPQNQGGNGSTIVKLN